MQRLVGTIVAVFLFGLLALAQAQDRGALTVTMRESVNAPPQNAQLYAKSHALVIGLDAYQDAKWPRLRNAVADAEAIAKELETRHGFTTVRLEKNLAFANLDRVLRDFFIIEGGDKDARLVLWFAGHGHTVHPNDPREEGYLVPVDAPGPERETAFIRSAISMSDIDALMRKAVAKHVLAIFDSCFSGTIFKATRDADVVPPFINWAVDQPVRQMITSGDKAQKVADDGTFRKLVIAAFKGEEERADANGDGYILGTELGLFLQGKVVTLTAATATPQTPQFGKLNRLGYDRGDVVFKVARAGQPTPATAPQSEAERAWAIVRDRENVEVLDAYIKQFPETVYAALAKDKMATLKSKLEPAPVPALPASAASYDRVQVLYGTDRNRRDQPKRIGYGFERGRRLEVGRAVVTVPKLHQLQAIERPFSFRVPYINAAIYHEIDDPSKHFTLQELVPVEPRALGDALSGALHEAKASPGEAFVFVHGFNTDFDEALYRAGQIAYDIRFDGAAIVYSWPSGNGVAAYLQDRESVVQTEVHFGNFLETLLGASELKRLHVLSHGLGAAPVLQSLAQLRRSRPELASRIGEVIFAAPDVDRDLFTAQFERIRAFGRGVTLYAGSNDLALTASKRVSGGAARAGEVTAEGPIVQPGLETIDITAANSALFSSSPSGFAGVAAVSDLAELLKTGTRPPHRRTPGLELITTPKGAYWRLRGG